jgi:hypothetical protein
MVGKALQVKNDNNYDLMESNVNITWEEEDIENAQVTKKSNKIKKSKVSCQVTR